MKLVTIIQPFLPSAAVIRSAFAFSLFVLTGWAHAASTLTGKVVDASDGVTPVYPVLVALIDPVTGEKAPGLATVNQPDGSYELGEFPPGDWKVLFDGVESASPYINELNGDVPCFTNDCQRTVGEVLTIGEGVTELNADLEYGATLFGRVTDASDGITPVYPVLVALIDPETGEKTSDVATINDPDGSYEIGGFPPGEFKILFEAIGSADIYIDELYNGVQCDTGNCDYARDGDIYVFNGGINELYIDLESGLTSSGISNEPGQRYVSVVAGGNFPLDGTPALTAPLREESRSLAVDSQNRLYFSEKLTLQPNSDAVSGPIHRVEPDGLVSTIIEEKTFSNFKIANDVIYFLDECSITRFNIPTGDYLPGFDIEGNDCETALAVEDSGDVFSTENLRIFRTRFESGIATTSHFAGSGSADASGDGGAAKEAGMNPEVLAFDHVSNALLVWGNQRLRRIDLETATIETLVERRGFAVTDLGVAPNGDVYLAVNEAWIYRLSVSTGQLVQFAGNGTRDTSGDGGPPSEAGLLVTNLAVDSSGNVFFSKFQYGFNSQILAKQIRKIDPEFNLVSTVVGLPGFLNCARHTSENIWVPGALGVDENDIVYVYASGAVFAIDSFTEKIYAVAGLSNQFGETSDGELAFGNPLNIQPAGWSSLAVNSRGDVLITEEDRIRKIDSDTGLLSTVADGLFTAITFGPDGLLYGYQKETLLGPDPGDFLAIDIETGVATQLVNGGYSDYTVGETAENKNFGWVWDLDVDSDGNIYFTHSQDDRLYTIDGVTKTLGLQPGISRIQGFYLNEQERQIYYVIQGDIIRNDLDSNENFRVGGLGTDQSSSNAQAANFPSYLIEGSENGDIFSLGFFGEWGNEGDAFRVFRISYSPTVGSSAIPNDLQANSKLGDSVASKDSWIAVGVPGIQQENGKVGEVLVYQDNDCRPILRDRLRVPEGLTGSRFGAQVAFVGEDLVIGAFVDPLVNQSQSQPEQGELLFRLGLFVLEDRRWRFEKNLTGSLPNEANSGDGENLVASGDTFAVGSPNADGGRGVVTVFNIEDIENPVRVHPTLPEADGFGRSLALNGDQIAVGLLESGLQGAVETFTKEATGYNPARTVVSPDGNVDFATALAMNEETLYVGAPSASGGRVFDYDLESLTLFDTLSDPHDPTNPSFGESLAVENGVLVVGAPDTQVAALQNAPQSSTTQESRRENNAVSGQVIAFGIKDSSGRKRRGNSLFSLLSTSAEAYGEAVDISEGRIVVGAPETDNGRGAFESVDEIIEATKLSGLWFDPGKDGEGFNVLVADAGIVVYYYGYTSDGERLWLVSEAISREFGFGEEIHVPIYKAVVGDFANPVSSDQALVKYGLLSMTFGSTRSATFTINGFDGNKISRNAFLLDTEAVAGRYSGLWYDPNRDGEGFNVISGQPGTVIYYYGSSMGGERLWLISDLLGNNITDGATVRGRVYEATGGSFDRPRPSVEALREWGTIEARFDSCTDGRFLLSGSDGTKTSDVLKLAGIKGVICARP